MKIFSTDCFEFNPNSSVNTDTIIIHGVAISNILQIIAACDISMPNDNINLKINMKIIGQRISLLKQII